MLTTDTIENFLINKFNKYDWFHSVGQDQYKRTVLYVKYLNSEVLLETKDLDRNILIHFSESFLAFSEDYTINASASKIPVLASVINSTIELDEIDIHEELWNLQRICGRDNLENIFYEVHDGDDAVTSLSSEFPEVRVAMEVLYNNAGFDVLFEELDSEDD